MGSANFEEKSARPGETGDIVQQNLSVHDVVVEESLKVTERKEDFDEAFEFVLSHGLADLSPEEEHRVLRKIDFCLMPMLLVTYTLNFMDKQALSYSANFGLRQDNHLHGNQYSFASGTVFFLAYLVSQPVMARLVQWVPIGRFVSVMVILWGVILMCIAASRSFAVLMTLRALLGSVESCINPAFIIITSQWYTRDEQPARVGYWFIGNAIGAFFGGLLGYGIGHINYPGTAGNWIWFFVIFGAITICFGASLFFLLPNNPMQARWLSDRDRAIAVARVVKNKTGISNSHWKWNQFRECLLDPKTWLLFIIALLNNVPAGGLSSFGNIVIKGYGYSAIHTTLLAMPTAVIQAFSIIICGIITQKFKNMRCLTMSITQLPAIAGAGIMFGAPIQHRTTLLAGYYITSTHSVSLVMAMAILTANYAGYTKKATASAIMFIGYCTGQAVAPQLFIEHEAPRYRTAFVTAFSCYIILTILPFILQVYLWWENRRRDRRVADLSEEPLEGESEALMDMTDWEQKDKFRYVW